jgi:hypothetical protein
MPDSPDYSKYLPNSNRFSLNDMGELAARLGANSVYDRRGEIVWYDNFDFGLGTWQPYGSPVGWSIKVAADNSYRHPYNVKMASNPTINATAELWQVLGVWKLGRVGIEVQFAPYSYTNVVELYFQYQTGLINYYTGVRLTLSTKKVALMGSAGTYVDFGDIVPWQTGLVAYNPIKLVIDFNKGKYSRLMYGETEYNISSIPIRAIASVSSPEAFMKIKCATSTNFEAYMRLAHVILTSNEP